MIKNREPRGIDDRPHKSRPARRWAAWAVLVLSVPLFLLSVAALAVFYAAPIRFGALLSRLPGDEIIRSLLIFAPATLLGVVVLALLYALERPAPSEVPPPPARVRPSMTGWAGWLLVPIGALFLVSVAVGVFQFVSPDRFAAALRPLPGDRYLVVMTRWAPWGLLVLTLAVAYLAWRPRAEIRESAGGGQDARAVRLGALFSLLAAVPLLLLSVAALLVYAIRPGSFERLLARLTQEAFVRMGLLLMPAVLLSLVLLALMLLFFSQPGARSRTPRPETPTPIRQTLAVWVLTGGLAFSAVLGLGLSGVAVYLLLR